MKKLNLAIFLTLFSTLVFTQDSSGDKFRDANLSMEEKKYEQALLIWEDLLEKDPDNSNLNYKAGICYTNLHIDKHRALPFLEKACKNITKNYDIFSAGEKNAPIEALFYLGEAYHLDGQLEDAELHYQKFLGEVSKKHILHPLAEKGIRDCATAREFMANPMDISIENLGDQINTRYHEHSPVLSLDENIIFFTSRRLRADSSNAPFIDEVNGKFHEDIYVSYKSENGTWEMPELLSFSRKDGHDASVSLNPNGQSLYVYRDDYGNGTLYESKLVDDVWTLPVVMGSNINTPKSFESHLSVTPDGKTLYFSSDRSGGLGGIDIYMCKKLPNEKWGLASNLGSKINTPFDDNTPFIHPDGKTLYFTSKGHKNMGGYDIFFSTLNEDGTWTDPINMGYPINTTGDEETFTTSPDGKRAYYSSYKTGGYGDGDIYMISLNQAEESGLTLVKGKIVLPEGAEFPKNIRILLKDNETGDLVAESRPLKRNGSFVFIVPPGKNYNVTYEIDGKEFYQENTYVPKGTEYKVIQKEVPLDPLRLDATEGGNLVAKNAPKNTGPIWQLRNKNNQTKIGAGQTMLYLADHGERVLYEEPIDSNGFFKYHALPNQAPYIFKVNNLSDAKMCEEGEVVLVGADKEQRITLVPDLYCIFTPYQEGTARVLSYNRSTSIPEGSKASYLDGNGNISSTYPIDKEGYFTYVPLPSQQDYRVSIESPSGNKDCAELLILISTKDSKRYYLSSKGSDCTFGTSEYQKFAYVGAQPLPEGTRAVYLNEDGTILYEEVLNANLFRYRKLSSDKPYRIKLVSNDQTLCLGGELLYSQRDGSGYKLKPEDDCIYKVYDLMSASKDKYVVASNPLKSTQVTESSQPVVKADPKMTEQEKKDQKTMEKFEESLVQNTKSLVDLSYKTNFEYNKNKIQITDSKFKKFIKNALVVYKAKGSIDIAVESGASKVPTKSFASNDELARTRAYQAKDLIIEELVKAGVDKDKINIRDITYLTQGPDYKKDPHNLKLYRPFQYVKLWVTNNE